MRDILHRVGYRAAMAHENNGPIGVLLANSGTPDSLKTRDVRRFLKGLLSDPRVVELPRALWFPILYTFILPLRPARIARKYQLIWTDEGSPLTAISQRLAANLRDTLKQPVEIGMLYSKPAVPEALRKLRDAGARRIVVLPHFPQYCAATNGAVHDRVAAELKTWRWLPEWRFVADYHNDAAYIEALRTSVLHHWADHGRTKHLLASFHGIPQQYANSGDPYFNQCHETARLLAKALNLSDSEWSVSFQSRFGPGNWLKPYTIDYVGELAKRGVDELTVVCPGFGVDCLETLEEIGVENRAEFLTRGGKKFLYVPALNARPEHTQCLGQLIARHAAGWAP